MESLQADIQDLLLQQQRQQQLVEEKQCRMRELKAEVQVLLEQQQRQLLSASATDRVDTEHRAEVEQKKSWRRCGGSCDLALDPPS